MNSSFVVGAAIVLAAAVFALYAWSQSRERRRRLAPYMQRPENMNAWRAYDNDQATQAFTGMICECLELPQELALRLQPNDTFGALYDCMLNVDPSATDGLDFAEAFLNLEDTFGGNIPPEAQLASITLGTLFEICVLAPDRSGSLVPALRRRWQ